jgi:two-component system sensor histidine kinase AlgZ
MLSLVSQIMAFFSVLDPLLWAQRFLWHWAFAAAVTLAIVSFSLLLLCLYKNYLQQLPFWSALLLWLAIPVTVTIFFSSVTFFYWREHWLVSNVSAYWYLGFIAKNAALALLVAALIFLFFYQQAQALAHLRLEANSRLAALQARIRPHFLFNSLNSISSLIALDPAKAEAAVGDLAALFRAALREDRLIPLHEELAMVRHYLALEALRLAERLTVHWQLTDLPENYPLPPLLLQPLVENAIYHGIQPSLSGGVLWIQGFISGKYLIFSVKNTLPAKSTQRQSGHQLAQNNIRARLELYYGNQARFSVQKSHDHYLALLSLPLAVRRYAPFDRGR